MVSGFIQTYSFFAPGFMRKGKVLCELIYYYVLAPLPSLGKNMGISAHVSGDLPEVFSKEHIILWETQSTSVASAYF